MSKVINLHQLYIKQLKDLLNAESQLVKAFNIHLMEAEKHAMVVESVMRGHDEKAMGKRARLCKVWSRKK
jgi:ferritin-like metal-binding protein YciE